MAFGLSLAMMLAASSWCSGVPPTIDERRRRKDGEIVASE